jgi:hypothetical protein
VGVFYLALARRPDAQGGRRGEPTPMGGCAMRLLSALPLLLVLATGLCAD